MSSPAATSTIGCAGDENPIENTSADEGGDQSPRFGKSGSRASSLFGGGSSRRRINKFYKQQCNLLENYENDSKHVQSFQQKKQLQSQTSNDNSISESEFSASNGASNGVAHSARQQQRTLSGGSASPVAEAAEEDAADDNRHALGFASIEITTQLLYPGGHKKSSNGQTANGRLPQVVVCETGKMSSKSRDKAKSHARSAHRLALFTLFVNLTLTVAKGVASYLSGSLSIISSLVDSMVDITSGLVIWMTSRAIKKHDPYLYPVGRTRLEPVALVIVSVIMAVASAQMIVQSFESMYQHKVDPRVATPTLVIMISTICVKIFLYFICIRLKHDPSIRVLAQDHRNDCLSNSVALICAYCAQQFWVYLDPIGAIFVALYIAATWFRTGREHLLNLSGRSAKPEFINRIIKVCIDHDARIQFIDTVLVYHFGTRFLVEVHIVMDENMRLKEAHDISESLQNSIESLPEVERAFVHVDYEFMHKPQDEHKVI